MKRPDGVWITALVLGWFFDFLFWKHAPGISFAIFVVLCLAGGFLSLGLQGARPAWRALLLLPPLLFFAATTFWRLEPMTVFLAVALTLLLMGILAVTVRGGGWLRYGPADYLVRFLALIGSMLARPIVFLATREADAEASLTDRKAGAHKTRKQAGAVVGGLLIALPILAIFASLLASADMIFADWLKDFATFFHLEKLPEYLLRGVLIVSVAYLLAGVFLHAIQKSSEEKRIGAERPLVPPFLGFIQATVVLGSVVALFTVFVVIQFQYFFGGQANIHEAGYTYAEYARRGFGELVTVAFFSLVLFLGLSSMVRREGKTQRWVFSGLGMAMVVLVGVILVSAFQRLLLYEAAYGFSRLRIYTHVFMIWLGIILAAVAMLDMLQRQRQAALTFLLAALGFAASLNLLNVDGFIVRQNLERAAAGQGLDVAYLASLSDDAVPALVEAFQSEDLPPLTRDAAGAVLVCRLQVASTRREADWRAFHLSRWQAKRLLTPLLDDLKAYQVLDDNWPVRVITPASVLYKCSTSYSD